LTPIPIAYGGVAITFNIPSLPFDLQYAAFLLDPQLVIDIWLGVVNNWRDPRILSLNPAFDPYLPDTCMILFKTKILHLPTHPFFLFFSNYSRSPSRSISLYKFIWSYVYSYFPHLGRSLWYAKLIQTKSFLSTLFSALHSKQSLVQDVLNQILFVSYLQEIQQKSLDSGLFLFSIVIQLILQQATYSWMGVFPTLRTAFLIFQSVLLLQKVCPCFKL
jgi:hypothetical protein